MVAGFTLLLFLGCHAAQEKAWKDALASGDAKIKQDEFLGKYVDHFELERRQYVRVYIKKPVHLAGYAQVAAGVTKILGEELFAQEGNTMKQLLVKANLIMPDGTVGDELVECRYTPANGVEITKDRSMLGM
jgi:hypothetical protein